MQNYQTVREQLMTMLAELNEKLDKISTDMKHEEQPPEHDFSEQAVENENNEVLDALGIATRNEVEKIKQAIRKIDAGSYGFCEMCGEPIKPERLAILPYINLCITCAQREESK